MPVMHIIRQGTPELPSGMFYARAIAQLYLMAGSVHLFGPTEWSLRLPSVLCGLALIPLAFVYGRRFLRPAWNLGFCAVTAFLPAFIADSQEARMYVFLLASLALYSICLFRWERTDRSAWLAGAVLVMLMALQFHTLAVFGAFLVFFPGLLHADERKLLLGAVAFAAIAGGYWLISGWVSSFYPPAPSTHGVSVVAESHLGSLAVLGWPRALLAVGALAATALSGWFASRVSGVAARWSAGGLMFTALMCELVLFYHAAVLFMAVAVLIACRHGRRIMPILACILAVSALLALTQLALLHASHQYPGRKVFGAMIGMPSIWPMIRMAPYSLFAVGTVAVGGLWAAWRIARGGRVADHWLFFLLGVWLPVLLLGLFAWNVEQRYTEFVLFPLFISALSLWQDLALTRRAPLAAALGVSALMINPVATARVVNAGYTIHPDHKGAAEFIRSLHLGPRDILVAEDVNQQTYYLGKVDYWLVSQDFATQFVELRDGALRDIYTSTPLIGTGAELRKLLDRPERGAVYVIGSGELMENGRREVRGHGISEVLASEPLRPVYKGRDGLTVVWAAPARGAVRPATD